MTFRPGDRIRVELVGDDGLPTVRYGFVGGVAGSQGPIVVMLDGELSGDVLDPSQIKVVTVTSVELCLHGSDLMQEADLRRGLVALWQAEADAAGLDVDELRPLGDGLPEADDAWTLAELLAGGEQYVVRAYQLPHEPDVVRVRADRRHRWDG